ncbi:MAG: response regulator transcription factor [Coprobacillaceae bacterium]
MRILLVEDEKRLAAALKQHLIKENYQVDVAYDGITAEDLSGTGIYDIIILDRMLPGKSGIEVLKTLRKKEIKSATIFLTAKDTIEDRIEGLDAGADDYLVKPFSTKELLARIRALGRRPQTLEENHLCIGNIKLHTNSFKIELETSTIILTTKESHLLEYLILNQNRVLSKEQIIDKIWGFDSEVDVNSVELYIYYIRKKLSEYKTGIQIETIRGAGYCLKEIL